eukprot:8394816-Pyramimonas_sp.AAC.1
MAHMMTEVNKPKNSNAEKSREPREAKSKNKKLAELVGAHRNKDQGRGARREARREGNQVRAPEP